MPTSILWHIESRASWVGWAHVMQRPLNRAWVGRQSGASRIGCDGRDNRASIVYLPQYTCQLLEKVWSHWANYMTSGSSLEISTKLFFVSATELNITFAFYTDSHVVSRPWDSRTKDKSKSRWPSECLLGAWRGLRPVSLQSIIAIVVCAPFQNLLTAVSLPGKNGNGDQDCVNKAKRPAKIRGPIPDARALAPASAPCIAPCNLSTIRQGNLLLLSKDQHTNLQLAFTENSSYPIGVACGCCDLRWCISSLYRNGQGADTPCMQCLEDDNTVSIVTLQTARCL